MVCGNDRQGFSLAERTTGTDGRCRMDSALCFSCYSGYQFTKGSGWEIRCFSFLFFENHVFMLLLAFSGSGRTGEFCLLAFDINCRLHQVLSLSTCLALLSRSDFTFFPSFFILFYSLWILCFMSGPLHNQHFALIIVCWAFSPPFGCAQQ